MAGFNDAQKTTQLIWWEKYSKQPNWSKEKGKWGKHGGAPYEHIVKGDWTLLLWKGIQKELPIYLRTFKIKPHSGVSNLLSSWITAANLYFPARTDPEFKRLLLAFLQKTISSEITDIEAVELEYAEEGDLGPDILLGEMDGGRGSGQTSPDVAFIVKTSTGTGLILTECKYTEHNFYSCSGRRAYPDKLSLKRCMHPGSSKEFLKIPCQQHEWKRKYLDHFEISQAGRKTLTRCPAATAGYQLMRQQSLANGFYKSGKYDLVVSAVSFDGRNQPLIRCLAKTGIPDFQSGWAPIYEYGADFITWHHQDWVDFVRKHPHSQRIADWLDYMKKRYQY